MSHVNCKSQNLLPAWEKQWIFFFILPHFASYEDVTLYHEIYFVEDFFYFFSIYKMYVCDFEKYNYNLSKME